MEISVESVYAIPVENLKNLKKEKKKKKLLKYNQWRWSMIPECCDSQYLKAINYLFISEYFFFNIVLYSSLYSLTLAWLASTHFGGSIAVYVQWNLLEEKSDLLFVTSKYLLIKAENK